MAFWHSLLEIVNLVRQFISYKLEIENLESLTIYIYYSQALQT
jgi:hypothetical protein